MDEARFPAGIYCNILREVATPYYFGGGPRGWSTTASVQPPLPGNTTPVKREPIRATLPLLEVSLDVQVVATTSTTLLRQVFSNFSDAPAEKATYCFPLYDGSVVTSFKCWVGTDSVLEGEVKPKQTAKAEFDDAVARKHVAALLEGHTPEIFETSLGNIPAKTNVRVEITYATALKPILGGDGVSVTIPTSIAPRYGSLPDGYTENSSSSTAAAVADGLRIKVDVSAPVPIRSLESRTHPISVSMGSSGETPAASFASLANPKPFQYDPTKATATLSDRKARLGKDFVLLISTPPGSSLLAPSAILERSKNSPDEGAVVVSFTPGDLFNTASLKDTVPREIVFLADRSASMQDKMDSLKRSLKTFLHSIPGRNIRFNICSFGSDPQMMWLASKEYSQETLDYAIEYINDRFHADMGGTDIISALRAVCAQMSVDQSVSREVILMTDGEIWEVDKCINFVASKRKNPDQPIRFFTLGIGDQVSHRLIEGIAREGGGFAEVLAVDSPGAWDKTLVRMLKGALTPPSWECSVKLLQASAQPGSELERAEPNQSSMHQTYPLQAPYQVPPLHAFSRAKVYFLIKDRDYKEAEITAKSVTGETSAVKIQIEAVQVHAPMIGHMAAKAAIDDLETGRSWLHTRSEGTDKRALERAAEEEAVKLGVQWKVAGKWTSFIALDKSTRKENSSRQYLAELVDLTKQRIGYSTTGSDWAADSSELPISLPSYMPASLSLPVQGYMSPGSTADARSVRAIAGVAGASTYSFDHSAPSDPPIQYYQSFCCEETDTDSDSGEGTVFAAASRDERRSKRKSQSRKFSRVIDSSRIFTGKAPSSPTYEIEPDELHQIRKEPTSHRASSPFWRMLKNKTDNDTSKEGTGSETALPAAKDTSLSSTGSAAPVSSSDSQNKAETKADSVPNNPSPAYRRIRTSPSSPYTQVLDSTIARREGRTERVDPRSSQAEEPDSLTDGRIKLSDLIGVQSFDGAFFTRTGEEKSVVFGRVWDIFDRSIRDQVYQYLGGTQFYTLGKLELVKAFEWFWKICNTAVAVAYIEVRFAENKDVWDMVVQKAKGWLGMQGLEEDEIDTLGKLVRDGVAPNFRRETEVAEDGE